MARSEMFKIVMKQDTYDILTADTGFYAFMDNSRLYFSFIKLVAEEDVQMFVNYVEACEKDSFILRLVAVDGSIVPYYANIEQGIVQGQLQLTLIDIAKLIGVQEEINSRLDIQMKLLELYGDDLFIYYPHTDEVKLITKYNIAPEDRCMSLEAFEGFLKRHVEQDKYEDIAEFVMAIRTGSRYFTLYLEGNVINGDQEANYTVIKGASIYEEGERVVSTGYIHSSMEQTSGNIRKAELDSLTGVLSKGEITDLATRVIDVEKRQNVSIAIVDVDYFKKVNDIYGHMVGDDVLKKVAAIMTDEVGNSGVVGRIGGDEFFILYYDAYDLETARERLRSIKNTVKVRFPENTENKPAISLSMGCAAYPKDADNYNDLFALADFALYRAKEKGRNRYIIYDKEKHGSLAEIHKSAKLATRINSRGDMSRGDILCVIMERVFSREVYPLDKLLDDYIENFQLQRITIFDAEKGKVLYMAGSKVPAKEVIEETQGYIQGDFWQKKYVYDDVVINDISIIEEKDKISYEMMKKQGIISCIHIKFRDKNGLRCILSLEAVSKKITWNNDQMHYYKLMARMLTQYSMTGSRKKEENG